VEVPSDGYHGRASFYSANGVPGACGRHISDSDFVVALDYRLFESGSPGSQCGRKVEITHGGKSIVATVLDASPTTEAHGLDLTRGAYAALASLDQGTIDITWRFVQ
jgi:expansin (peptidoglycan-binding protein)